MQTSLKGLFSVLCADCMSVRVDEKGFCLFDSHDGALVSVRLGDINMLGRIHRVAWFVCCFTIYWLSVLYSTQCSCPLNT